MQLTLPSSSAVSLSARASTAQKLEMIIFQKERNKRNWIRLRRNKVVHSWTENELIVDSSESSWLRVVQGSICSIIKTIQNTDIQAHSSKSWISSGETANSLDKRARSSGWWFSWMLDASPDLDAARGELS